MQNKVKVAVINLVTVSVIENETQNIKSFSLHHANLMVIYLIHETCMTLSSQVMSDLILLQIKVAKFYKYIEINLH